MIRIPWLLFGFDTATDSKCCFGHLLDVLTTWIPRKCCKVTSGEEVNKGGWMAADNVVDEDADAV